MMPSIRACLFAQRYFAASNAPNKTLQSGVESVMASENKVEST